MNNEPTYLFEDPLSAKLFSSWHPEKRVFDLVTWAESLTQTKLEPAESRLTLFKTIFTGDPDKAEAMLITIESMREALILTEEDIEFCFSALASTPKNTALKKAYLSYLESPLAIDWTAQLWTIIEALKSFQELPLGFSGQLILVPALNTSYLFQELATALKGSPQIDVLELKESWELAQNKEGGIEKNGIIAIGSAPTSLFKLAEHGAKWLEKFKAPSKLHFSFHGSLEMKNYLCHALHHFGIQYWEASPTQQPNPPAPHGLAELIQKIRNDATQELKDRLKLSSVLLEDPLGRRPSEPWEQYFEKLVKLKKITEDQQTYLRQIDKKATPPIETPKQSAQMATLLPFSFPPIPEGHSLLAFASETLFDPPPSIHLLRPGEREMLHQAGFSLPRPGAHRERQIQLVSAFQAAHPSHRVFCTNLPLEKLPSSLTPRILEEREFNKNESTETNWVELPSKPLSATQLETYARCPTQYFFSQRLRLQRSDAPESKYPLLFGQATHLALENFFQDPAVDLSKIGESESVLMSHFQKALAEVAPSLESRHPLHVIMSEHFRKFAKKVPGLEKNLQTMVGKSEVIAFEKPFEISIEGFSVRGKIDRIDKTETGDILVLDYKTGTVDFTPNHIIQGEHFQALLYLLAAETLFKNEKAGLLFYDLKKGEVRRGILLEEQVSAETKKLVTRGHVLTGPKYEEIKEKGIEQLKRLAKGISSGDYSPRPSPQICDMCDYIAVCRRGVGYA